MLSTVADVILPVIGFGSASYLAKKLWPAVKREIIVEIVVQSHEEVHDWLLRWLQKQLKLAKVSTLKASVQGDKARKSWWDADKNKNDNPEIDFLPGHGWHHVMYHGYPIYVYFNLDKVVMTGWAQDTPANLGSLTLWCFGRDSQILQDLLEDARDLALARDESLTKIFTCSNWGRWKATISVKPRPLATVILEKQVIDDILLDAKEFLGSERWYRDRGVPYRRGYLLYGEPGCGKTSLVKALAGELGLDIGVVSLSGDDMDDKDLKRSLHNAPKRVVLLLEDVDSIFIEREAVSHQKKGAKAITFSGLLNALDGVASQEGRLVFMTTNHIEKLDPALIRPGRCDRKIKFELSVPNQAKQLFRQFFPQCDEEMGLEFSKDIPEKMLSMAQIQGHLIKYKNSPDLAIENVSELLSQASNFSRKTDPDMTIPEWLDRLGGESLSKYAKYFAKQDFHMVEDLRGFTKTQLKGLKDGEKTISEGHQMKIFSLLSGQPHALKEFQYVKNSSVRNEFRKYFMDVECATELEQKLAEAVEDNTITLGQVKSIFQKHFVEPIGEDDEAKKKGEGEKEDDKKKPKESKPTTPEERATKAVQNIITLATGENQLPEGENKENEGEEKEGEDAKKKKADILVSEILEEISLSQYFSKFEEQDCISADVFGELTEDDLKDIFDIQIFGHRKKILKEVAKHKPKDPKKGSKDKKSGK